MMVLSSFSFSPQDVGHACLESYSRILESLAHTIMSRIEDVQYADYVAQNPTKATSKKHFFDSTQHVTVLPDGEGFAPGDNAMTLSDLLTWSLDQGEDENDSNSESESKQMQKLSMSTTKKTSYLDNLGGTRSPTSRH